MKKTHYLTPGPSELYFTTANHIQTALKNGVGSISHRSTAFKEIYAETVRNIRELLQIPSDYHIVFTSSATEIWERLIQNCSEENTFHLVNGAFSQRFYETALQQGRNAQKQEAPFGSGFDVAEIEIPNNTEMLCVTPNETSSGAILSSEDIYCLRAKNPDVILAVDAVSVVPYLELDISKVDSLFFSVQKGMGLPAGLGVWIFNDKCVRKAKEIQAKGKSIGLYRAIPVLLEKSFKNQTFETPNVVAIYTLGKVCGDMLEKGIATIRQETNYKAAFLYNCFEEHTAFELLVGNEKHRSKTVIVIKSVKYSSREVIEKLEKHGILIGTGYGKQQETQIRIANFPTHSKELILHLIDLINELF